MTNKLVVIINSPKVPKIKKILLCEMKFLAPNYSCLQDHWLEGYHPQIPDLSVLCPQLNLLNPPQTKFLGTPLVQYQKTQKKKTAVTQKGDDYTTLFIWNYLILAQGAQLKVEPAQRTQKLAHSRTAAQQPITLSAVLYSVLSVPL